MTVNTVSLCVGLMQFVVFTAQNECV